MTSYLRRLELRRGGTVLMRVVARACFEPPRQEPGSRPLRSKANQRWTGHSRDRPPSPQTPSVWPALNHQKPIWVVKVARDSDEVDARQDRLGECPLVLGDCDTDRHDFVPIPSYLEVPKDDWPNPISILFEVDHCFAITDVRLRRRKEFAVRRRRAGLRVFAVLV